MDRNRSQNPRVRSARRPAAAAVELAILLPFLLLLFVAAVDFARVYYSAQTVAHCAWTGAQYAANPDMADRTPYESVQEIVTAAARDLRSPPVVGLQHGTDALGHPYAEVTVSHSFKLVCAFGIAEEFTVTRTARARLYPSALEED